MKKTILIMLLCISIIITGKAIDPPGFTFSPDTIDVSGVVNVKVTFKNYAGFQNAQYTISSPFNDSWTSEWIRLNNQLDTDTKTFRYYIDKYDVSGLYKIKNIHFFSFSPYIDSIVAVENSTFYVMNTKTDTIGPLITNFFVSKDTAYPGDTVVISFDLEDTLSGIAFYDFTILNSPIHLSCNLNGEKKIKFNYQYIVGKYEALGKRELQLSFRDNKGNYSQYNSDSLNFKLEVKGTIPDTVPPVIKSVYSAENSDSLYLYINAHDNLSGIKDSFYCTIDKLSPIGYWKYLDLYRLDKVNDTLLRCNLTAIDPYLISNNYYVFIKMQDNVNNEAIIRDTVKIENSNSDNEFPKIESVSMNKDTIFGDGNVTLNIRVTDDASGIKNIDCSICTILGITCLSSSKDFDKKGITDTTVSLTFKLPEYGPSGRWQVTIYAEDYENSFDGITNHNSTFVYCPKYLDISPPVFDTIIFEPRTVNAGDTERLIIKAYDHESGIKQINYNDDYSGSVSNWEMIGDKTYQAKIPINKYAPTDTIYYFQTSANIVDFGGNIGYQNINIINYDDYRHSIVYTIANNGLTDNIPPKFDSLKISPVIAGNDDTIKLSFYLHDNLSGINTSSVSVMFSTEQVFEFEKGKGIYFIPEKSNKNKYTYSILPGTILPGRYHFNAIDMSDSAGNRHEMESENFFDREYCFEIQGEPQVDTVAPELINVKGYPAQVKPGDKVEIEIKVLEKASSLYKILANLVNLNGVNSIQLNYNDWKISQLNDTFTCKANYTVPKFTYSGKWAIQDLNISDSYFNTRSENGNSYDVFEVIDGQSLSNRKPCWIIPSISLTIDAGQTLNYAIPDYLVSDIDGDQLTFYAKMDSGNDLPTWISFSSNKLNLTITPANENAGRHKIYIYASDPKGLMDSLEVNLRVIKVGPPAKITSAQSGAVNIYPNPANNVINVICQDNIKNILLYDLTGKLVMNITDNKNTIDVSKMIRGIYILKTETEKTTFFEKIILR